MTVNPPPASISAAVTATRSLREAVGNLGLGIVLWLTGLVIARALGMSDTWHKRLALRAARLPIAKRRRFSVDPIIDHGLSVIQERMQANSSAIARALPAEPVREERDAFAFWQWHDAKKISNALSGYRHAADRVAHTSLLKEDNRAYYINKHARRGHPQIHETNGDIHLARRIGDMAWAARIGKALTDQRLRLFAQRILPLVAGSGPPTCYFELLLRLIDENDVVVSPMAFLPAAERRGLMPQIDRWVIARAFELLQAQADRATTLCVSINLSATSINEKDFIAYVRDKLHAYPNEAPHIIFEITETAAIVNIRQASRAIWELKEHGCRFALDDFGSGMSSLSYLKNLPVDFVKIDGSFVRSMEHDRVDREMVASINHLAHVMDIETVAEFVESPAIIDLLRTIGVDYAQGYAVGRPMPVEDALREGSARPVASALIQCA